jgi:TonB family protein
MMRGAVVVLAVVSFIDPASAEERAAGKAAEVRFVDAVPRGPTVAERLDEIRRRIQAALVYPPLARRQHLEGEALVRFEITHSGEVLDVSLQRTSGKPLLDRAATRAVVAAAPLPWVWGQLEVPVHFELGDAFGGDRDEDEGGT